MKKKYIQLGNDWSAEIIGNLSDHELFKIFQEIITFRETGMINQNTEFQEIIKKFKDETHQDYSKSTHLAEDQILFEVSRRYFNEMIEYIDNKFDYNIFQQ